MADLLAPDLRKFVNANQQLVDNLEIARKKVDPRFLAPYLRQLAETFTQLADELEREAQD